MWVLKNLQHERAVLQDGDPKIAFSWCISGLAIVYGRYNELDYCGIHGVYKPTNIRGPHPVLIGWLDTPLHCTIRKVEDALQTLFGYMSSGVGTALGTVLWRTSKELHVLAGGFNLIV